MAETDCNADTQANALFTSLTSDVTPPPTIDMSGFTFTKDENSALYGEISTVDLADLTTVDLEGTGVFDKLMKAMDLHIEREFHNSRITGDQYAEVYTQVATAVLGQATQFALTAPQAKWAGIQAQMQARIAEIQAIQAQVDLERAKVDAQKSIYEMQNAGAAYALTKMQIANADASYCLTLAQGKSESYKATYLLPREHETMQYNLHKILPAEYEAKRVTADRILPAEAAVKEFENRELQPIEKGIQSFQLEQVLPLQQATAQFNFDNMLPVMLGKELHILNVQQPAQTALIKEQQEVARSQTMDTRLDGLTTITGSVGKQKDLYTQQIDSFVKDSKQKAAKMYLDGWITQKTLDENLAAPTELQNTGVNAVLAALRAENGL
jgi:hypothetical protein